MSLWYDKRGKSYTGGDKESWLRVYAEYLFSKSKKDTDDLLIRHFTGQEGQHSARTVIMASGETVEDLIGRQIDETELLQANLANEINTRTGDVLDLQTKNSQLQAAIDREKQERKTQNNSLNSSIETEKTTRQNSDQILLESLNQEISDRESGDLALQESLEAETDNRKKSILILQSADSTLQSSITKETALRENAVNSLREMIDTLAIDGWNSMGLLEHKGTLDFTNIRYSPSDEASNFNWDADCMNILADEYLNDLPDPIEGEGRPKYMYWVKLTQHNYGVNQDITILAILIDDGNSDTPDDGVYSGRTQTLYGMNGEVFRRKSEILAEEGRDYHWSDWEDISLASKSYADTKANQLIIQKLSEEKITNDQRYLPRVMVEGQEPQTDMCTEGIAANYQIYGYSEQSDAPEPENPAEFQSVGDLVTTGKYSGKYKIETVVSSSGSEEKRMVIYLDEPLRKIGNYTDYIDWKRQKVVRNVDCTVLSGTEDWMTVGTMNCVYYTLGLAPSYVSRTLTGNRFAGTSGSNLEIHGSCQNSDRLYFCNTDTSTLAEFKVKLQEWHQSGKPLTVCAALKTPVEEDISLPSMELYEDYNNVTTATALSPSKIVLEYCQNPTKVIAELRQTIAALQPATE